MKLAREASSSSQLVELASSCKRHIKLFDPRRFRGIDEAQSVVGPSLLGSVGLEFTAYQTAWADCYYYYVNKVSRQTRDYKRRINSEARTS